MGGKVAETSLESDAPAKAVIPKRSHRKSRRGCVSCKQRKVKCDEARPVCRSCRIRRTPCEYASAKPNPESASAKADMPSSGPRPSTDTTVSTSLVNEPLPCLPSTDAVDMKLLWFYTSTTHKCLSYADDRQQSMNDMLQTAVVQLAFTAPFLLDSILELASLHMHSLGQTTDPTRALVYQARSSAGFRKAISDARPQMFGALLVNSVLRPILSSQFFRDASFKDFYLLDWVLLWRGTSSLMELTTDSPIESNGLRPLFSRPPPEDDAPLGALPKQLLLMVSFIGQDEDDAAETPAYQESLRALASLFSNLRDGVDSIMVLRLVTWGTRLPLRFLELAKQGRPRALIILAHYAAFLKLVQDVWWLAGVGNRSLRDICHVLGPEWQDYLNIPHSALLLDDNLALFRVILGLGGA